MTDSTPPPTTEQGVTGSDTPRDRYADLALHAGYWVVENDPKLPAYGGRTLGFHNVHHVDVASRRITVYAQARVHEHRDDAGEELVISPPQLEPGTCGTDPMTAQTVCAHPNAVYLDGSGEEAAQGDGTGAWWVKHSWVLDGEGYRSCQLMPPPRELLDDDVDCLPVIGTWLDDDLTMRVGPVTASGEIASIHNERRVLLDRDPVTYQITRVDPRPEAVAFVLEMTCRPDATSPLDGSVLGCPASTRGTG
jgi:hypothetical protein